MPSALTGNTSGLATAVSPGLVGTSTQTFAGDKTLTGLITASGGIINTGLTGTNATTVTTSGSGKVGEIRTFTDTFVATGWTRGTVSFTLQTGVYMWIARMSLPNTAGLVRAFYALGTAANQSDGITNQITTDGNPSSVKDFFATGFTNVTTVQTVYAWAIGNSANPNVTITGSFLRVS